ncbi:MAG: LuxR C-terminal-related transcriptional regulator [Symbiobacteriia bacterium]
MSAIPAPLLTTKLYLPPARPNMVRRPRLTTRLAEGLQRPLTLVSAPAGFGKTTLLSEWRTTSEGRACPLAWLSLDRTDNDPQRFWAYVTAALRTLPGLAGLPAELAVGAPPDLLLAPLINGLDAATGARVLVLDDYHTIEAAAIHGAVNFLVEHLPAPLHVVILTRSDPPWPLARLRANGHIAELREADLRFTPGEAAEFLTGAMGLPLPPGDVAVLEQRTEGWIAALQMAAISLEDHPDPHGFVTAFSGDNRYIADYLAEEAIALQPEPLRRFLLEVSVLERFSTPLCQAVTGCAESWTLLGQVERKGLFLVPLDPEHHWFRFHHLFGDLLRTYLQRTEPELIPDLHRRASAWYAANDMTLEAAGHSLAAGDYDRTLALIEQHAEGWWAMASPAFLDLMLKLPPEVIRRSPASCAGLAWMNCVLGQLGTASALLEAIDQQLPQPVGIESFAALLRAYIAELSGKPYGITEIVLRAPEYIPEKRSHAMRNGADVALAYVLYRNGRFDPAAALLLQVAERDLLNRATGSVSVAVSRLARLRLIEGRVADAHELCRHYGSVIQAWGETRFWASGNVRAVLADVLRLQGDLEEAATQAREAVRLNRAWNIPHGTAAAAQSLAQVRLAQGAADETLALLDEEESATRGRALLPDLVSERAALRVQAWLALGDLQAAQRWARESGLAAQDPLSFRREIEHIALARVLLASGRESEGKALLSRLAGAAAAGGRLGRLGEIHRLERHASGLLIEPLSERETEILALLAKGWSNQEIATALVVAIGTVKTHVHHICGKLEAPSRTRAVARARELGLVK